MESRRTPPRESKRSQAKDATLRLAIFSGAAIVLVATLLFALFGIHGHWIGCLPPPQPCDPSEWDFMLRWRVPVIVAGGGFAAYLAYLGSRVGEPRWPKQ